MRVAGELPTNKVARPFEEQEEEEKDYDEDDTTT